MRKSRHSFATCVAAGRIYTAGGISGNQKLSSVEYYSEASGVWTEVMDMPDPRSSFELAVVGNRMYAVGGDADSTIKSIDSEYSDNEWSEDFLYIPYLQYTACVALKENIYVVGWSFGHHDNGQFGRLRPEDGFWSFASLPEGARFSRARLAALKTRPCQAEQSVRAKVHNFPSSSGF